MSLLAKTSVCTRATIIEGKETDGKASCENVQVINPRCTCAARVTVLGLCVCVCVCVSVTQHLTFHVFILPQTILTFSAVDEGRILKVSDFL